MNTGLPRGLIVLLAGGYMLITKNNSGGPRVFQPLACLPRPLPTIAPISAKSLA